MKNVTIYCRDDRFDQTVEITMPFSDDVTENEIEEIAWEWIAENTFFRWEIENED